MAKIYGGFKSTQKSFAYYRSQTIGYFLSIVLDFSSIQKESSYLVAFSGGADSTALLHALAHQKDVAVSNIHCCHFDHGLRAESKEEMLSALSQALEWGVVWHHRKLSIQSDVNMENRARDLRYKTLFLIRQHFGLDWILTAHHRLDQAETLLMRLERGTSLAGLRGIHQLDKDRRIIRPLLWDYGSHELKSYLKAHGIVWSEDSSNQNTKYRRNAWRQRDMERFEEFGLGVKALNRLAHLSQDLWMDLTKFLTSEKINPYLLSDTWLSELKTEDLDYWVYVLESRGLPLSTEEVYKSLSWLLQNPTQQYQINAQWYLQKQVNSYQFIHRPLELNQISIFSPLELVLGKELSVEYAGRNYLFRSEFLPCGSVEISNESQIILSAELGEQLTLRTRLEGDFFSPSPYRFKSRKLKKFFQEFRVPENERGQRILLTKADQILWIPGLQYNPCFVPANSNEPCWKLECYVTES